jgi:hypothetical protein
MTTAAPIAPIRLVEVLRALPSGELDALATRLGASIDPAKKVDPAMQLARVLVALPELRDPSRLPAGSGQLLRRIAEAGGTLRVPAVPPTLEPLAARGIVYARAHGKGQIDLMMPAALFLQVPAWEGEDPRGMRALLAQASADTLAGIASHYLGKPATPPIALALETAWETLCSRDALAAELERLPLVERRLLESVEREGGEVETDELLDLEREPLRLRSASGPTPSRRGVGFALERRAMLIPVHPNRHLVPTEVAAIVGAARATSREGRRAQIREFVLDREHEPRRARFALDPVPLAVALAMAAREAGTDVREGAGVPRSLAQRLAQRFGRDVDAVSLVVALSRALGLWDATALSKATPPGAYRVGDLGHALFDLWRRGGAWDEARAEPEMLRVPPDARDPSPIGVLREVALDALQELGEGHWVPWEALADYVRSDARTPGVTRLLRRWAERAQVEAPIPSDVARRIVLESLPTLGLVDVGESFVEDESEADLGPLVRITPRGRAILQAEARVDEHDASCFASPGVLRIGAASCLATVLGVYPFVDIGKVADQLELSVSHATLARAVSLGIDAELIRAAIEAVAPPSEAIARALEQLGVVVGRVTYVAASAFLWCDDANVREMLRTRRQTADLFHDPSPPGGLLIAEGKDLDAVARRCRALGVEVMVDGQVVRARSTVPPRKSDRPPGRLSTKPPARVDTPAPRRSKMPPAG